MQTFVAHIVVPKNERVAEKLFVALRGKGAFRRFKDVLYAVGDEWVQAWYHWREDHLHQVMKDWFESLSVESFPSKRKRAPARWLTRHTPGPARYSRRHQLAAN